MSSYMSPLLVTGFMFVALTARAGDDIVHDPGLEKVPPEEAAQIDRIVDMTLGQLKKRYPNSQPVLRGVHPKDHGCVQAKFRIKDDLPDNFKVGVFAQPGKEYQAWIRFSNANVLVGPDSTSSAHGSRGMAIKLLGVEGTRLVGRDEPLTQDFLMVNHPVFAFSNVEDYEVLSRVLLEHSPLANDPTRFFTDRIKRKASGQPDMADGNTVRAVRTLEISKRIQSLSLTDTPPAYQPPPSSPVDNQYFSGAPYKFGNGAAMKFRAKPKAPSTNAPDLTNPNYLRDGLRKRLIGSDASEVVFEFQLQVRSKSELAGKLDKEIEDACTEWDEATIPFVSVATITIPPQDFDTDARKKQCENLFFTPWHCIAEHQPLGGINRLKLKVYEASSKERHLPKEPSGF